MRCSKCASENPAGFRYCGSCGEPLPSMCPNCGAEASPAFRYCGACGYQLEPRGEARASDQNGSEAELPPETPSERRRVTVLFADLVGYSTLAERTDPEDLQSLMVQIFSRVREEIEARGGMIEKFIGDAIVGIFGAPQAHEDDPTRAVEAALAILDLLSEQPVGATSSLQLRIGINSGLVVSGGVGDGSQTGVLGDTVNVAARLQQLAGPGEVLVGGSVWRRVRDGYEFQEVGTLRVKGREQPVATYRITGRRERTPRLEPPFVGRANDLALLELLWTSAVKGNTHVVSLVGDPGVGKSRLLSEFHPLDAEVDIRVACHSDRAFGPFLQVIEGVLGGHPQHLEDLRGLLRDLKLEELTLTLGTLLGLAEDLPVVGLRDEQMKQQVFGAVLRLLEVGSGGRRTLIVLEDLDRSDLATLELLSFVLSRIIAVPLLVVLAHRPGFEEVGEWTIRAHHTGLMLEELTPGESAALARGALRVETLTEELEGIVASQAEGNPFFIQELLLVLLDIGALRIVDGQAALTKAEWQIPDTIQGTVLARMDRLVPNLRTLLQHASVIGRTFSTELLEMVIAAPTTGLQELARAQLIVADGARQWRFKHGLMQEVTYDTLTHRQRRKIHQKVAEALEKRVADDPSLLEPLADHFARAEILEKARTYALAAGDSAAERMGFVEARKRYETALRLWGEGDEEGRLALLLKLGYASLLSAAPMSARALLVEAEAGWRALGNRGKSGAALAALGRVYFFSGDVARGTEVLMQAIEILESEGPSPDLVQAYIWTSIAGILVGDAEQGVALARRGLEMAERLGMVAARSHLENSLGVFQVMSGDPAGVERLRGSIELAEQSSEAEAIGRGYLNTSTMLADLYQNEEGIAVCRRGRDQLARLGVPSFEWVIAGQEAIMLVEQGRFDEAESLAREILGPLRPVVVVFGKLFAGTALGEALVRRGRYDEAFPVLDEILPSARGVGGPLFLLPILVLEAELEAAVGDLSAARETMGKTMALLGETATVLLGMRAVVPAIRLETPGAPVLLESLRRFDRHLSFRAILIEAQATLEREASGFLRAADLYAELELPLQEARCSFQGGRLDRAADLMAQFGLAAALVQGL